MDDTSRQAARACRTFVLALAGLLALAAAINLAVNPYGYYPTRLFPSLRFRSHADAARLLARAEPPPEVLVLGSSRLARFEPSYVARRAGGPTFNVNVNNAHPESWLAFLRYAVDGLELPVERILLGIEPLSFNGEPLDELATSPLAAWLPERVGPADRLRRWEELLTSRQLSDSLRSVATHLGSSAVEPFNRFGADGMRQWPRYRQAVDDGSWDHETQMRSTLELLRRRYSGFEQLEPWRKELFERFLGLCRQRGIEVVAFITPLHPRMLEALRDHPTFGPRHRDLRDYLDQLRKTRGLRWLDLSEIDAFAGSAAPSDWLDGQHHMESNARRIVDRIFGAAAEPDAPSGGVDASRGGAHPPDR